MEARSHGLLVIVCLTILYGLLIVGSSLAQQADVRAVPADFLFQLTPPGQTNSFLRPGAVCTDPVAREVYVADQGNNRIVVFDEEGTYRFEFSIAAYCGSVRDMIVSPEGIVFVLGSAADGIKLLRFDFDGQYLGEVAVKGQDSEAGISFSSLGMDAQNRLFLLDGANHRIIRLTADLTIDRTFPVLSELSDKLSREAVIGSLTVAGEQVLIPVASLGSVYRYSLDGDYIGSFGYKGTKIGELAFPVAVEVTSDGLYLVLDKQRFTVLCYSPDGRFVGEFGGKGQSLGWFYFPSMLAVDSHDRVYIGQIFLNRVQVCAVPQHLLDRLSKIRQLGCTMPSSFKATDAAKTSSRVALTQLYRQSTSNTSAMGVNHVISTLNLMEVQHA